MTSHEFARALLALPDVTVLMKSCYVSAEYSTDVEAPKIELVPSPEEQSQVYYEWEKTEPEYPEVVTDLYSIKYSIYQNMLGKHSFWMRSRYQAMSEVRKIEAIII